MLNFTEIWFVDFEFMAPPGDRQNAVCLVAHELISGRRLRVWQDDLKRMEVPPYAIGPDSLFIAYYASAEMGCHLSLGWPLPINLLDLFTEFRNITNGLPVPCGNGLLGAMAYFGLPCMEAIEKDSMRSLILRGGPWTSAEQESILDYCESDVITLKKLYGQMESGLDLPHALLRGAFMKAAAHIEFNGIPIDTDMLERLSSRWDSIQDSLISKIDVNYGVFEGRTFKLAKFESWLIRNNIPWPRLESGALDLQDDTFKEMARAYRIVAPLRELRVSLSQMRLSSLSVGRDGRNRCLISAFQARTGRNQPSNSQFIFGPSVWLRGLIRPKPGYGLAYIDWSQQEFGIAAALSGDLNMIEAYQSGDPYLTFAKQAGAVPADATKEFHGPQREQFKQCALAVQYGMGAGSLSKRIGQPVIVATDLIRLHKETYRKFWAWSDDAVDYAMLHCKLWTVFGWTIHIGPNTKHRSLLNFPMQANGAEMLRLACCLAVERGVKVCAPVHDALLIEAPLDGLTDVVAATQMAMADASAIVLDGFRLRSDAKVIRYPDRYMDERGIEMWDTIQRILDEADAREPVHERITTIHQRTGTCSSANTRPILYLI